MSDDEDEGQLRIVESPSDTSFLGANDTMNSEKPLSPLNTNEKTDHLDSNSPSHNQKEEGEIDDDDAMETSNAENLTVSSNQPNCPDEQKEPPNDVKDEPPLENPVTTKKEPNGDHKKPSEDVKTPSSTRKRKEQSIAVHEGNPEKRKSGVEAIVATTPSHRSKRTSHQLATAAISACFNDDEILNMAPMKQIDSAKKQKKDAATNVWQSKSVDTSDILESQSLLDAPPGSSILIEITVSYRTRDHLAFKVKGQELYGFFSDGLPPMSSVIAKKRQHLAGNGDEKMTNNNGRGGRSGSQAREINNSKGDKRGKEGKKKVLPTKEEEDDIDVLGEDYGSKDIDIHEVDTSTMHSCHYDNCEKKFTRSSELEYHITKNHLKKMVMSESICCQTEISSFNVINKSTETDRSLNSNQMPVLNKETPMKNNYEKISSPAYSDLSEDEPAEKKDDKSNAPVATPAPIKPASTPSAAAALMGIAGGVASTASTPSSSVIGINPNAIDKKAAAQSISINTQPNAIQKTAFVTHSPRNNPGNNNNQQQQQQGSAAAAAALGIPPNHPMHFLAQQFAVHPGMMMPGVMPSSERRVPTPQNLCRAPSRQDAHKIHELAKPKDSGRNTPKSFGVSHTPNSTPQHNRPQVGGFLPPHMMLPANCTPQMLQNLQLASRGMMPPTNDVQNLMNSLLQMSGTPSVSGAQQAPPGFPNQSQQHK